MLLNGLGFIERCVIDSMLVTVVVLLLCEIRVYYEAMMKDKVHERVPIRDPFDMNYQDVEDVVRYRFFNFLMHDQIVLDVGCGTGYGSLIVAKEGACRKVIGLDISRDAMGNVQHTSHAENVYFVVARAEQLPILENSIDVVVSMETIEHLVDPIPFLREVRRVVHDKGMTVISTPLNNSERRLYPSNPYHKREYSQQEFEQLSSRYFKTVKLFSQVTSYQDDLPIVQHSKWNIVSFLKTLLPLPVRALFRKALGSKGWHPSGTSIVDGIDGQACVQIAVCS